MDNEKKKDKSSLLALALLLLAAFFVFLFLLPEGKKPAKNGGDIARSKEFEDRVNRHLFETSQTMELSREKMQLEANRIADQGLGKPIPKEDIHKLDFSADPRAEALLKELGRDVKNNTGPSNADEQVQADLFEAEKNQEYSEAYKAEYARQFVENARKAGYIIKLSSDYKVISVTPIRKPADNYDLFKGQGAGAQ